MKKKKLLSLALAVTMLFGSAAALPEGVFSESASITASAESDTKKSGDFEYRILDDGTAEITKYNGKATKLTISSSIGGKIVTGIGERAFYECTSITSVTIPKSVKCIGEGSFDNCSSLKSVNIPSGVTNIEDGAFYNCKSLASLTIQKGVESIGGSAFQYCTSLKSVTVPNSVKSIGEGAFSGCTNLTNVTIQKGVTSICDSAFYGCKNLTSVTIPNSVKIIGNYAFDETKWLGIQQKKNPLVVVNGILIDGKTCKGKVTIPSSVTSIGVNAFYECTSLTSITIPKNVKIIGDSTFCRCTSLTNVNMQKGVNSIGNNAFYGCKNLTNVTIPSTVKKIGYYAFDETKWLENQRKKNPLVIVNGILIDGKTCKGNVTIPSSVTSIGDSAFRDCISLKSITIPSSVTSIGGSAFENCSSLTNITIPKSISYIDSLAFFGTKWLANKRKNNPIVIVNGILVDGNECKGKVTIPNGVKRISGYAFAYSQGITSIDIPDTVKSIGECAFYINMFAQDPSKTIKSVTIPKSVTEIGELAIGYWYGAVGYGKTHKIEGFTIKCYKDTAGEKYAKDNGFKYTLLRNTETKVIRLSGDNRYDTSISIANQLKKLNGNNKFKNIIIASGTGFSGALSSAYLAKIKDAPILIVGPGATDKIVNYVKNNSIITATIYIIGGEAAVSKEVETKLKKTFKNVKRLWGKDRFETNLAVLREAGGKENEIIIGNGLGYADTLSASATGKPILLTAGKGLTDNQKAYLKKAGFKYATLIGEKDVVSEEIESDVKKYIVNVDRQGGRTRFETSVLIAKKYFKNPSAISIAYGLNYPDGLCGAPLSMKYNCPLILATDKVTDPVKEYSKKNGVKTAVIYGGNDLISDKTVKTILSN